MEQRFKAIGVSFRNTTIEVREKLAMDEISSKKLMAFMKDYDCSELMVVSTCNRTEFYYTGTAMAEGALIAGLAMVRNISKEEIIPQLTYYNESEAVNHLFRVSIGLEAQVIGDLQIINQVKRSYQWSADEDMAGPFLHRLMHTIFYTNKRVVQETAFRDGAASVSYAAKELIEDVTKDIIDPKILILGVGEIGKDVAKNLAGYSRGKVYVSNRTRAKAQAIAAECGFEVIDWSEYQAFVKEADVVVSSVAAQDPIVSKATLGDYEILSHKFFIDLSVPRSIATDLEDVNGALVYNIDEIQSKASESLQTRIEAIPQVESIVEEAIVDFNDWAKEMIVSPTIKKLKNALEQIRQEELSRYLKNADAREAKLLDKLSKSMMQKVMKLPVLQLKAACQRGDADQLIGLLHDLFDLEGQMAEKEGHSAAKK